MAGKGSVAWHGIVVQYAISSNNVQHRFVVEESMKDISLEVINVDGFLENMVSISKSAKVFLRNPEESTTKSGDHYVALHSFTKENLTDNRKQAMQRLMY